MAVASVAAVAIGLTPPGWLARLALMGILGAAAISFRSLTVEVDDEKVSFCFGEGPIKKSFALADIEEAGSMRTTPLMGWGVHFVGGGWLYNVYGLDAVEICFKSGERAFIGTDEPDSLARAINSRLKASQIIDVPYS